MKSEEARRQGAAGAAHSLLPAVGEEMTPPRAGHQALIAAILLVNLIVMLAWWRPFSSHDVPPLADSKRATPAERPTSVPPIARPPSSAASGPQPSFPDATQPPAPMRKPVVYAVTTPLRVTAAPVPKQAPPAVAVGAPPSQAAAPPQTAPREAGGDALMPPDMLKEIPPLAVSGFIQEAGKNTIVIVNDRLLHEGDEAVPGVKLEKILADGLLFSYKGYRFKR